MTAILQLEAGQTILRRFGKSAELTYGQAHTPLQHIYNLACAALIDTCNNGGTFVMVVSDEKITLVQHDDAKDFDGLEK